MSEQPTPETGLTLDRFRMESENETGIFVRAQTPAGKWISADIWQLDRRSLHRWLRSRGGRNLWAENCVLSLLGHEGFDQDPDL